MFRIKEITKFTFIRFCSENKKTVIIIMIFSLMLSSFAVYQKYLERRAFESKDGVITSVNMNELSGRALEITLEGKRGEKSVTKQITVFQNNNSNETNKDIFTKDLSTEEKIGSELSQIYEKIFRQSGTGTVSLPEISEEGTKLIWKKKHSYAPYLMPFVAGIMIVVMMWQNEESKKKSNALIRKRDIINALPSFNNKLLLLLGSGMVYEDAMSKIADGYQSSEAKTFFGEFVIEAFKESKLINKDISELMAERAEKLKVRELSRITAMIADNRYKGSDLREKLDAEGRSLWRERTRAAEEAGKLAETKLAIPLAVLLFALIIISAAPAMLQI